MSNFKYNVCLLKQNILAKWKFINVYAKKADVTINNYLILFLKIIANLCMYAIYLYNVYCDKN